MKHIFCNSDLWYKESIKYPSMRCPSLWLSVQAIQPPAVGDDIAIGYTVWLELPKRSTDDGLMQRRGTMIQSISPVVALVVPSLQGGSSPSLLTAELCSCIPGK